MTRLEGSGDYGQEASVPTEQTVKPVTLAEAKLFLRVHHDNEDAAIQAIIDGAQKVITDAVGFGLSPVSPEPLRLALLMLALRAYERGDTSYPLKPVEAWINPYRSAKGEPR